MAMGPSENHFSWPMRDGVVLEVPRGFLPPLLRDLDGRALARATEAGAKREKRGRKR